MVKGIKRGKLVGQDVSIAECIREGYLIAWACPEELGQYYIHKVVNFHLDEGWDSAGWIEPEVVRLVKHGHMVIDGEPVEDGWTREALFDWFGDGVLWARVDVPELLELYESKKAEIDATHGEFSLNPQDYTCIGAILNLADAVDSYYNILSQ